MTEERSHTDIDGVSDPLVSRTYRESASEHAPDALNQAVLRQAAQNVSSRYSRAVFWMRPMAWAATIGLCLAIVIDLSSLPQPDSSMLSVPAEGARLDASDAIAPQRIEEEALERRARKTIDAQGRVKLQNAPSLGKAEAPKPASIKESDAGAFSFVASPAATAAADSMPMPCGPELRAVPESWLECIVELENAGLEDLASQQRELLQEAFPDFELP